MKTSPRPGGRGYRRGIRNRHGNGKGRIRQIGSGPVRREAQ